MTNATDVIAYLLPRKAAPIVERQTGLPFGWGLWLRALPERLGRITRERADAVVATLAARASLRGPDAAPFAPGRWRAFRSLFYQGWGPPPREERWMRWLAGFSSSLLHLLFFLFLLWVALVQIPPPPAEPGDSSRVRLEMIGDGSPAEPGGEAQAGQPEAGQSSSARSAASVPAPQPPLPPAAMPEAEAAPPATLAMDVPPMPPRDVPVPELAPQPLQVTEVPEPTRAFVLPPSTARLPEVTLPSLREPGVPTREIPAPVTAPAVVRRDLPARADVPAVGPPGAPAGGRGNPRPLRGPEGPAPPRRAGAGAPRRR
ncbi:hypothetical protein CSC76_15755, partial [Pseudoxanthomonas mexicana]